MILNPFIPQAEALDPASLVPMSEIDYSIERKGNAVIVRKHYPPPIGDRRMAPAVRIYPSRGAAIRVFSCLEKGGHRACTDFYYRTRQEWQDREQANAWTEKPQELEVQGLRRT